MERPGPPSASPGPGGPSLEPQPRARPSWVLPAGLAAMAVTYVLAFLLRVVPFWPAMAVLSALSWWVAWDASLPARLRPSWPWVRMGVGTGLALYAVFLAGALVLRQTPAWPSILDVIDLVKGTASGLVAALVIVLGTSPGEEVLWRGAVFARLAGRLGPGWKPLLAATLLYALFVGLSGSPVLSLAAGVCGAVWTRQRQVTGSLVPGIVSHALWSTLMFAWFPGLPKPF